MPYAPPTSNQHFNLVASEMFHFEDARKKWRSIFKVNTEFHGCVQLTFGGNDVDVLLSLDDPLNCRLYARGLSVDTEYLPLGDGYRLDTVADQYTYEVDANVPKGIDKPGVYMVTLVVTPDKPHQPFFGFDLAPIEIVA